MSVFSTCWWVASVSHGHRVTAIFPPFIEVPGHVGASKIERCPLGVTDVSVLHCIQIDVQAFLFPLAVQLLPAESSHGITGACTRATRTTWSELRRSRCRLIIGGGVRAGRTTGPAASVSGHDAAQSAQPGRDHDEGSRGDLGNIGARRAQTAAGRGPAQISRAAAVHVAGRGRAASFGSSAAGVDQ